MRAQQQAGTEALVRQATMAKLNDTLSFTGKLTQGEEKTPQQVMAEEATARQAAERQLAEKQAAERQTAERIVAEKAAVERLAVERAERDRLAQIKIATERMSAEKMAADKILADKRVADQAAAEKIAADKAAAERLTAEKIAGDKVARELAEKEFHARQAADPAAEDGMRRRSQAEAHAMRPVGEAAGPVENQGMPLIAIVSKSEPSKDAAAIRSAPQPKTVGQAKSAKSESAGTADVVRAALGLGD